MLNDGLRRPGADDEDKSFYLRGDKVWRRLAFKAPLVGPHLRPHQPVQDAQSILPADVIGFCHALIG